ncbi:MAG: branched-chain amino acid aminotransferase [Planctomycetales bacterium]|jgi:hypothetical protein
MPNIFTKLINDETGFIVSAELILVATIAVLGVVVGFSEIAFGINNELEDVASAFGSVNQSFYVNGFHSEGKACTAGSEYEDDSDTCDSQYDIVGSGYQAE